ncbi:MAG: ubiquinone/menaquinone biosynthesis methyltransferase [Chloroflexi bacterium]|nr:ubiquinone/menaquinone biosynthesis methyltransferase [Chloroflexota bacterium]
MTHLAGAERAAYVQTMFARIASRYDLMNRLMTGGQDVRWRKEVIRLAHLPPNGKLLDLGTGTGDLAAEALRQNPTVIPVGGDFTLEMMRVGKTDPARRPLRFTASDALDLPFPDSTFDAVTSGYLMRNVIDVSRAWAEQCRVLKPGGRVVCLDTTPPPRNFLYPFIHFHLHAVIPAMGRLIAGSSDAYTYLPDSTENFLPAEQLAGRMKQAGFKNVRYRRLMFGTMAIHWGEKGL